MSRDTASRPSGLSALAAPSLPSFIGQKEAVEKVRVALAAATADGTQFPHTLMVGPPGLGKSLLAKVIAAHMGGQLRETLAQTLSHPDALSSLLQEAVDLDVVFIDEADGLPSPNMVLLYRSLEEGLLFLPKKGANRAGRAVTLSRFTLLAATNNEFGLAQPLRDRFRLTLRFEYYQPEDLAELLCLKAAGLGWAVRDDVLQRIGALGRGTPRLAMRLLESCRRVCRSRGGAVINLDHFRRACEIDGIDSLGLDRTEQQYLRILYEAARSVRLGILAQMMSLPSRTVSSVIEDYLVRSGLVMRSDLGRELTTRGRDHVAANLGADRVVAGPAALPPAETATRPLPPAKTATLPLPSALGLTRQLHSARRSRAAWDCHDGYAAWG